MCLINLFWAVQKFLLQTFWFLLKKLFFSKKNNKNYIFFKHIFGCLTETAAYTIKCQKAQTNKRNTCSKNIVCIDVSAFSSFHENIILLFCNISFFFFFTSQYNCIKYQYSFLKLSFLPLSMRVTTTTKKRDLNCI